MPATLLLLDVDGVIVPAAHPDVVPAVDEASHRIVIPPREPGSIRIRPAVLEAVNRWAVSGTEVQWLTSWGWRTKWLEQVGLPRLPVFYEPKRGEVVDWSRSQRPWKKPAVERFLEAQADPIRLAWAEDEAFFSRAAQIQADWFAAEPKLSELLLVEPDCFVGLEEKHISAVDRFLRR